MRHAAQIRNPALRSDRAKQNARLVPQIQLVFHANMQVYREDKARKQLNREGIAIAGCTVKRFIRQLGLRSVCRGKIVPTNVSSANELCPFDRVNRYFKAQRPAQMRESASTSVLTWQGRLYVAFAVSVPSNKIWVSA